MTLARLSVWITHLLVLTSFNTLILSQAISPAILFIGTAGILASLWMKLTGTALSLPRRFWNTLTVLFFLFFIVDVLWISLSLLKGGVHFLIYLMIQKLFTLKTAKDDLQLYLIAFFQILATADGTTELAYGIAFVFFLILTTWALIFYHFRKEETGARVISSEPASEVITLPFFFWTNALTAIALAITLVIFLTIPRIGTGFFESREGKPQKITGFSERVTLGSIGPVKLDAAVVMRIEFPQYGELPAFPIYLKGMTFDRYANGAWENTRSRLTPLPQTGFRFQLPQAEAPLPSRMGNVLRQEIILEPIATTVLFAASQPLVIEGRIAQLSADATGSLHLPYIPTGRTSYEALSMIRPISEEDKSIGAISYPEEIENHYLQVEPRPRIQELALRLTEGRETLYEKVVAVQNYLAANYRYNLDLPPSKGGHPVEEFLFETKEGYCEHYASAMVLLLRQAGIASRMVSGFLPGEWNPFGKYLLVRQQDAHTWVEVYFTKSGWVLFDPTPASAGGGRPFALLSAYLDWMRTRWDRYVIRYSILDQMSLARDGWQWVSGPRLRSEGKFKTPKIPVLALLLVMAAAGTWIIRRYVWLTGSPAAKLRGKEKEATRIYRRLLKFLGKKGWRKESGQTPMEFARAIGAPAAERLSEITALYYAARFGPDRNAPEKLAGTLERLRALLSALEEWIARNLSAPSIRSTQDTPTQGSEPPPGAGGPSDSDRPKGPTGRHKPARTN